MVGDMGPAGGLVIRKTFALSGLAVLVVEREGAPWKRPMGPAESQARARWIELFFEVSSILSRSLAATHTYDVFRAASDCQLAQWGLRRSDLPRTAYLVLTGLRRPLPGPDDAGVRGDPCSAPVPSNFSLAIAKVE
jgi:hypothetical protein